MQPLSQAGREPEQPLSKKGPGNVTSMPTSHSSPTGTSESQAEKLQQLKTQQAAHSQLGQQQHVSQKPLAAAGPGHVTSMPTTHSVPNATSSEQQAKLQQLQQQKAAARQQQQSLQQQPLAAAGPGHVTSMPATHSVPNATSSEQQARLQQLQQQKAAAEQYSAPFTWDSDTGRRVAQISQQHIQSRAGASEMFVMPNQNPTPVAPIQVTHTSASGPRHSSGKGSFIAFAAFIAVFAICFFAIALS